MCIFAKLVQTEKAQLPIEVTESGIWILVKLTHLVKAQLPIEVTESGICTHVKAFGKNKLANFICKSRYYSMIS